MRDQIYPCLPVRIFPFLFILFAFSFSRGMAQSEEMVGPLRISLSPKQKLEFFCTESQPFIEFEVFLTNASANQVIIVAPESYSVWPHAWEFHVNGEIASMWGGGTLCAPRFVQENKIRVNGNSSLKQKIRVMLGHSGFSRCSGIYAVAIRYNFSPGINRIRGVNSGDLSLLRTNWTEKVAIQVHYQR